MDNTEIRSVLLEMGARVPPGTQLILVGGSALALLGSPRLTIDIDFIGDDIHPNLLHQTILQIAREMNIFAEPVPLDRFIPMPDGNEERTIRIGQFGNLEIFIADPYSIALSKLDRGADTDFDDLVFLVRNNFVILAEFERMVRESLPSARKFDLNPDILENLQELKNRLI